MSINQKLKADDILQGRTAKDILKSQFGTIPTAKDILKKQSSVSNQMSNLKKQSNVTSSYISGAENYSDFDVDQSKNNISNQLKHQFNYLSQRGYRYKHQKDMPFITEQMTKHLAEAGIKDIREIGLKEIETPAVQVNVIKKGNKYYRKEIGNNPLGYDSKLIEVDKSLIKSSETGKKGYMGQVVYNDTTTVKLPPTYELVNKTTGEKLIQGKYKGVITKAKRGSGYKWGNTTRTEGMTDFMIDFDKNGNAIIYPSYEDTATDLSGIAMAASIALAATGAGASFGSFLTQGAGNIATQAAVGNAVINGTIAEATGGDFFKAAATDLLFSPPINSSFDTMLGNTIFKNVPVDSAFKKIAGRTITNSTMAGVDAAIYGRDIGKAMQKGAITGFASGGMNHYLPKIFPENKIKFITDNTNFKKEQVYNILNTGVRLGVENMLDNRPFDANLSKYFIREGLSTSTSNAVVNSLQDSIDPKGLQVVQAVAKNLSNLYIRSNQDNFKINSDALAFTIMKSATQGIKQYNYQVAANKQTNQLVQVGDRTDG